MRQLFYSNYQSGNSGLSNGIMSIECGVVMAFLTKRFLLLDGNVSPPANIVDYAGRVDNSRPSRVTDLIDIPVPWAEPDPAEIARLSASELTPYSLMDVVFHVPGTVDTSSPDALDFARGRTQWVGEDGALAEVPLLRVSEQPLVPGTDRHRHNLNFYSYLFYLDRENRRAVYELLSRMQAQAPYAELARRVAADLGDFNAVHMRRGDFKVTYGVTVLDRQPWEAIEMMDHHFARDERLLLCTDERDDPFFTEILACWPDHVFIDHHILENYAAEFQALPQCDSLALAYLSQLVAARSQDFIGSMTSTFTAMIQRLRGNRGADERFKFFWNELPEPGDTLERGSHPVSNCVPLEAGVMVPEFAGTYSWNRYSSLINPAWMREWPESFITPQVLETGQLGHLAKTSAPGWHRRGQTTEVLVYFEGIRCRVRSAVPGVTAALEQMLYDNSEHRGANVVAELEVTGSGGLFAVKPEGEPVRHVRSSEELPRAIIAALVPRLARARKPCCWLEGMVLEQSGNTVLLLGDWSIEEGGVTLADTLCEAGWRLLGDEAIALRGDDFSLIPFARVARTAGQRPLQESGNPGLSAIVYSCRQLHSRSSLFGLSPSVAVAEMTRGSLDFRIDRAGAIRQLCRLAERVPAYQLSYSRPGDVPAALLPLLSGASSAASG